MLLFWFGLWFSVGAAIFFTSPNNLYKDIAKDFFEDEVWNLDKIAKELYNNRLSRFGFILGSITSIMLTFFVILPMLLGAHVFNKYFWKYLFKGEK